MSNYQQIEQILELARDDVQRNFLGKSVTYSEVRAFLQKRQNMYRRDLTPEELNEISVEASYQSWRNNSSKTPA